jgi:hypothetical protein
MFNLIKETFKPKYLKKASLLLVLMLFLTFSGCSFNNQSSLTASSQISSTSSLAVSTNLSSQDQVSLVAIEVNKLPTRLDYSPNEVVTTSGGELRVVYSDYSVRYISMRDSMIETNRLNISTLGNSSVTLKHQEGSIAKYITYNVNIVPFVINVNSVALDIVSSDVLRTQSVQLNPIITPLNGLVRDIKWSSSNPLIARVDNNGLVTPLNAGEVIITVTVNNIYSAASRLNILQDEIKEVTLDPTADLTFALTTPSPSGTNLISTNQATSPKIVSINVANNTSSVVITATKLAGQTVVLSGTNLADVTAAGTATAPTYTVNTSSVATNGGSKVFTLTVSESNKEDIVYNVSINVTAGLLNLDASNINSYPGSGTTWTNLSNNNLNGTINGATFDSINSGIFVFDGDNDYVLLGSSSTLKPANALTVEQWLYRETWTQSAIETALSNTEGGGYTIFVESNNIKFSVYINGDYRRITYLPAAAAGWLHVVGTFDGRYVRMHVNGVEVGSALDLTTGTITYNNSNATFIGAEAGSSSTLPATDRDWHWNGKIALTRIYSKALTASEITQNYNDTKGRFGIS